LTDPLVRRSANWQLLSEGLAFPAYFADSVNPEALTALVWPLKLVDGDANRLVAVHRGVSAARAAA
jgi:hypothetical protein